MGFPAQLDASERQFPHDDSVSHFAAKELQIVLRILVVLSIVATAVVMATFWFWTWIPVTVLLFAYIGLLTASWVENRTRTAHFEELARVEESRRVEYAREHGLPIEPVADEEETFTHPKLLKRESVMGLEIVIGLGLAALVLAFMLLPWELLAVGAVLFFLYMLFVMGPVWLGWFGDVEEEENKSRRNEPHGPSATTK